MKKVIQYRKGYFTVNGEVKKETKAQADMRRTKIANALAEKFKVTKTKH